MSSLLSQLKQYTTVVADTGDLETMRKFSPEDATTNPSLIVKALGLTEYSSLLKDVATWAKTQSEQLNEQVNLAADKLVVTIGCKVLELVPGRISTEVDARLSFDTEATINKARRLIELYQAAGIDKQRVLIKVAATWQGIRAAEVLEKEGINCNLTLLFSFAQARACAEAGVFLISPFVGRILDWYKAKQPEADFSGASDPGVISVTEIYNYYKQHGYSTVVMGASFRNTSEILELAGCDRLTIGPALLEELAQSEANLSPRLVDKGVSAVRPEPLNEAAFYWGHNQDAMATEKLAEGIRTFALDQEKLDKMLIEALQA
ncbi:MULTISPECIES: transaldolase [unclassified Agarivorans]|uniref:transaldolase n=1 Tax=unclassified Agarivorans TaxID=2636026 RepID=UPI003D7E9CA3